MTGPAGRQQEAPDHKKTVCKCRLDSDFIPDLTCWVTIWDPDVDLLCVYFQPIPTVLSVRQTETDPDEWDCWLKGFLFLKITHWWFCMFWSIDDKSGRVYVTSQPSLFWYVKKIQFTDRKLLHIGIPTVSYLWYFLFHYVVMLLQAKLDTLMCSRKTGNPKFQSQLSILKPPDPKRLHFQL